MSELILPDAVTNHERFVKVEFSDGTRAVMYYSLYPEDDVISVYSDENGVINSPSDGRYPFTEQIARLAVDHFNENGTLPATW